MITSVYLDNNATTRIAPEVALAMQPFLSDNYFNPGSPYAAGQSVKTAVEEARETVAVFLGATSVREIVFTGSATESINMAVRGVEQGERTYFPLKFRFILFSQQQFHEKRKVPSGHFSLQPHALFRRMLLVQRDRKTTNP